MFSPDTVCIEYFLYFSSSLEVTFELLFSIFVYLRLNLQYNDVMTILRFNNLFTNLLNKGSFYDYLNTYCEKFECAKNFLRHMKIKFAGNYRVTSHRLGMGWGSLGAIDSPSLLSALSFLYTAKILIFYWFYWTFLMRLLHYFWKNFRQIQVSTNVPMS